MISTWIGIDYGAKTSGNTVICHHDGGYIRFYDADRRDADTFVVRWVEQLAPYQLQHVFIDAPLSLPGVYHGIEGCTNFHYRACDTALQAMSPMFLGGLTARAIELKQTLVHKFIVSVYEVYPKAIAQVVLKNLYHKKLSSVELISLSNFLVNQFPSIAFDTYPQTQHQFDALLAWLSGYRFVHHQHQLVGHAIEGQVII